MMKKIIVWMMMALATNGIVLAQQIDQERMTRDIEVGEKILETMFKSIGNSEGFGYNAVSSVNGSYLNNYGVRFTMEGADYFPYYTVVRGGGTNDKDAQTEIQLNIQSTTTNLQKGRTLDSAKTSPVDVIKNFLADYGFLMSQVPGDEYVTVSVNSGSARVFGMVMFQNGASQQSGLMSVEVKKQDLDAYHQEKITRAELENKFQVSESETNSGDNSNLEIFSSIMTKIFSSTDNVNKYTLTPQGYEQLSGFGVIYNFKGGLRYNYSLTINSKGSTAIPSTPPSPTKEQYLVLENSLKESIVDYGRVIKNINDKNLRVNVKLTPCETCGIPSSLELQIKGSVLADFNSGKTDRKSAIAAVEVTEGAKQ